MRKEKKQKQKVRLTITRLDGSTSNAALADDNLTPVMLEAAEDLLCTMCNNARVPRL